jgi:hypothetical protein
MSLLHAGWSVPSERMKVGISMTSAVLKIGAYVGHWTMAKWTIRR